MDVKWQMHECMGGLCGCGYLVSGWKFANKKDSHEWCSDAPKSKVGF